MVLVVPSPSPPAQQDNHGLLLPFPCRLPLNLSPLATKMVFSLLVLCVCVCECVSLLLLFILILPVSILVSLSTNFILPIQCVVQFGVVFVVVFSFSPV